MISLSPTLELMKAETAKGRCLICNRLIRNPGKRLVCRSAECEAAWVELYDADRVDTRKAATAARRGFGSLLCALLPSSPRFRWWMREHAPEALH